MKARVSLWIGFILLLTGCAAVQNKEQIGVLIDYGNNQQDQEKLVKKEEIAFSKVKTAIMERNITVGMSSEVVESKLGSPVLQDASGDGERWVYKAGNADWLSGEIIRVYFDGNGNLKRWTCANLDCPKS